MAITAKWYGKAMLHMAQGEVIWKASGGSTIKVLLATSSYTPNQDTHEYLSDITNELTSGGGYTSGGKELTLSDPTYDAASNECRLDAADVTWNALNKADVRYAVIYKDTGVASTSPLLGYIDFGASQAPAGVDFVIQWDASGVLKKTAL